MPTENRSSNTEMVSVPRERLRQFIEYSASVCKSPAWVKDKAALVAALEQPAPQSHPAPIAWMVGTAFWWTKEEAERDAAATGLPIVGLGPMTCITPAERQLGEPVCLDGATLMGEPNFQDSIEWYREGISKHWKKICDLRAQVERLRAALRFYADREHFHFESGNWDTVSGEPLNILWCGDEPDFIEDGTVARNALSASAEPSAPECGYAACCGSCPGGCVIHAALRAQLAELRQCLASLAYLGTGAAYERAIAALSASAEPSAPVERDEHQEFEQACREAAAARGRELDPEALRRRADGSHVNPLTECGWWGWQARAALERKP